MTQRDKELLIKDLCARLPFNNHLVEYKDENYNVLGIAHGRLVLCKPFMSYTLNEHPLVEDVKPYLFPLSSITEEQKKYINGRWGVNEDFDFEIDPLWGEYLVDLGDAVGFINWCYENHFDINGLISMELANDATGLNIYTNYDNN